MKRKVVGGGAVWRREERVGSVRRESGHVGDYGNMVILCPLKLWPWFETERKCFIST